MVNNTSNSKVPRKESLCSRYLFPRLGQAIVMPSATVQWTVAGIKKNRVAKATLFSVSLAHFRYPFVGLAFLRKSHGGCKCPPDTC